MDGVEDEFYAWFHDVRTIQGRHSMDMRLFRTPEGFTGRGKDDVGEFVVNDGEIRASRSLGLHYVRFMKRYATHGVIYEGIGTLQNSVLTASGQWRLEHFQYVQGDWECCLLFAPPAA